ncbi:MAG: sulfoxide reductase catalytic subunit YedY [Rhizobacter sp.]|nr:sulfoxide reductase catalytic subunit YedY [Rhizobacter sp.]
MHFQPDRGYDRVRSSDITPQQVHDGRRDLLKMMATGAAGVAMAGWAGRNAMAATGEAAKLAPLTAAKSTVPGGMTMEKVTSGQDATTYNNYYEFGTDKADPGENAKSLKPRPWSVKVEGEVKKPGTFDLDTLLKMAPMEERIYRMRCVEGWSMVIPWIGFPLAELIRKVEPTGNAKYVEFVTLADKAQMPGLRSGVLDWPYTEALRMDEAMNPLALLTFGHYGQVLANASGAPVRMVTPWKYGFKGAKSIVAIRFVEKQPQSSWMKSAPDEYGFFANVNPTVDHPRWSQATERRIGEDGLFAKKRATLMFNGYEAQVGQLYAGMDLKKNY